MKLSRIEEIGIKNIKIMFGKRLCQKCNNWYKNEYMWRYKILLYPTSLRKNVYVCGDCCPAEEDIIKFYDEKPFWKYQI